MIFILIFYFISSIAAQCFNKCSQSGDCKSTGVCKCFSGYFGADCSLKYCPENIPLFPVKSNLDDLHGSTECSNNGICDYSTGTCHCRNGFFGNACHKMKCPNNCDGHGRCISLQSAAEDIDTDTLNISTTYDQWDSSLIYGCLCDLGYTGHDCSRRPCDSGPDPRVATGAGEEVNLRCQCTGTCFGWFYLLHGGQTSKRISWDASTSEVKSAILSMPSFKSRGTGNESDSLVVSYSTGTSLCGSTLNTASIEFSSRLGNVGQFSIYKNSISSTGSMSLQFSTVEVISCDCSSASSTCTGSANLLSGRFVSPTLSIPSASASEIQSAITSIPDFSDSTVSVSFSSGSAICVVDQTITTTITLLGTSGNLPMIEIAATIEIDGVSQDDVLSVSSNDGSGEIYECNGVGNCDYINGKCSCPSPYTFDEDYGPCGAIDYQTTMFDGIQTCPGIVSDSGDDLSAWSRSETYAVIVGDYDDDKNSRIIKFNKLYPNKITDWNTRNITISNMTGDSAPGWIVRDLQRRHYYISAFQSIIRFDMDAEAFTNTTTTWLDDITPEPKGLALCLDVSNRYLYFTQPGTIGVADGKIKRVALDLTGYTADLSDVEDLTSTIGQSNLIDPMGITIDLQMQYIYWTDWNGNSSGRIYRSSLDGSGVLLLENEATLEDPSGIVGDIRSRTLYIADTGAGKIFKRSMDENSTNYNSSGYIDTTSNEDIEVHVDYVRYPVNGDDTLIYVREPMTLLLLEDDDLLVWTDRLLKGVYFSTIISPYEEGGSSGALVEFSSFSPISIAFDVRIGIPTDVEYKNCYGHGTCLGIEENFKCDCFDGYYGSCKYKSCPIGKEWFGEPLLDEIAHVKESECSAKGKCDRKTGRCECDLGFTGASCERMRCGNDCSKHGRCMSVRQAAWQLKNNATLDEDPIEYSIMTYDPSTWDSDMVYGCFCDSGYSGYDCSVASCAYGYNHRTVNVSDSLLQVQSIVCTATFSDQADPSNPIRIPVVDSPTSDLTNWDVASIVFSFRGKVSDYALPFNTSSVDDIEKAIESIPDIGDIEIYLISGNESDFVLCNDDGNVEVGIQFLDKLGDLPLLQIDDERSSLDTALVAVDRVQAASNVTLESCSGNGICDNTNGICSCFGRYSSGDGIGNQDDRSDCSFQN